MSIKPKTDHNTNNAAKKFNVGDWVVVATTETNEYKDVGCIVDFRFSCDERTGELYVKYLVRGIHGALLTEDCVGYYINEESLRPWSILDAKDGDVLVSKDGDEILIFRNLDNNTSFSSYYNINGRAEIGWSNRSFIPATKEQCGTLMKAMTDARYTFDFEKKELKRIESKFKVGDWITNGQLTCKVLSVTSKSYSLHLYNDDYCHFEADIQSIDKHYRLWNIKDARDGDALTCYSNRKGKTIKQTGIFKQYVGRYRGCSNCFLAHMGIDWDGNFKTDVYMGSTDIFPATKEQYDILFQKMKEEGWYFNTEKKQLVKIENYE